MLSHLHIFARVDGTKRGYQYTATKGHTYHFSDNLQRVLNEGYVEELHVQFECDNYVLEVFRRDNESRVFWVLLNEGESLVLFDDFLELMDDRPYSWPTKCHCGAYSEMTVHVAHFKRNTEASFCKSCMPVTLDGLYALGVPPLK